VLLKALTRIMNMSVGGEIFVKDWLALYVSLRDSRNFILKTNYKDIRYDLLYFCFIANWSCLYLCIRLILVRC
jgi:hypothetical protein